MHCEIMSLTINYMLLKVRVHHEEIRLNELREEYLSFFESKGHLRLPSFSLVPDNDL